MSFNQLKELLSLKGSCDTHVVIRFGSNRGHRQQRRHRRSDFHLPSNDLWSDIDNFFFGW